MRLALAILMLFSPLLSAKVTIVHNVKGYTLTESGDLHRFSAISFEQGKVLRTGGNELLETAPEDSQLIDAKQGVMLPGLIDAHGHLLGLGGTLLQVDVRDVDSAKKTAEKVQKYANDNPELSWITGRGWNQVLWPGKQYPTAQQLDEYINNRPVYLSRVDGHAAWVNSKALELAGINKDTLDPPGGKYIRDSQGNPTGVLIDNAMLAVEEHLPKAGDDFYQASLDAAGEHLLSLGVTSMHDAGIGHDVYHFYLEQAKQKKLPVRIYAMVSATDPVLKTMLEKGHVTDPYEMLSIRSVKAYGDGALGSRGAALLKPYSDAPENTGLLVTRKADLKSLFDTVIGANFQLNYHAIGDRANRLALNQYEDTFKRIGGKALRHRVEHAQVVHVDDIPRFKQLNIIPSMQPTHATSDMNMAQDRVGLARLRGAYAWQTFLKQGSPVAFGSDFPVELANPFFGLHAAVTRQDRQNQPEDGWIEEEAVTLLQAFRGFTLDAAFAAHQEKSLGSLTKGKWADFILVDQDIFTIPATDLWKTRVLETWIAGEKVFQQ